MAKKAIKEETLPVEQVVVETTPVVETEEAIEVGEAIVEELPVDEQPLIEVVEEIVEQVAEIQEVVEQPAPVQAPKPVAPKAANEVGVVRILQKTPSGYRLLLETGAIVKVSKAQYTKGQSTVIL